MDDHELCRGKRGKRRKGKERAAIQLKILTFKTQMLRVNI